MITSMNTWGLGLIGLLWFGTIQTMVGQCTGKPITSFTLQKAEVVSQNTKQGEISVEIKGGESPFVYKLIADYRGKGVEEISISSPTTQRQYTFRNVPANTSYFYRVEVLSANTSEGKLPTALCQRRSIPNIELK
ncbi:MAG: hypothetical protein AAF992_05585 [Bacteroidota bacterium]